MALHSMAHSFIELDKGVVHVISNAEEAEVERLYEDLQDLLELTPKKDVLFIIGDLNVKVGSQEIPGVTGKLGCHCFLRPIPVLLPGKSHGRRSLVGCSPWGH